MAAIAVTGRQGRQSSLPSDTKSGRPDRINVLLRAPLSRALAAQKYNMFGSTAWTRAPKNELTRSQLAEAAVDQAIRLTSPDANPELIVARRYATGGSAE